MRFLLHYSPEGRIGICHEGDAEPVPETAAIAWLTFEDARGLLDDLDESFIAFEQRGGLRHPDNSDEPDENYS